MKSVAGITAASILRLFVETWANQRSIAPARVEHEQRPPGALTKPGCMAADEALVVYGHLIGLSKGWGGFGVLRTSHERLKIASAAAVQAGAADIAVELQRFADKLPSIHSEGEAHEALVSLEPLLPKIWNLGKSCKVSENLTSQAKALAQQMKSGEISREQAVATLQQSVQGHR